LNFEDVTLHVALILRHCLPSLKSLKEAITFQRPQKRTFSAGGLT
jgi:hypothetical protein